jgi:antitoxin (DNA-binding transcriptional repressor) of toxin-antitoxin stability system
MHMARLAEEASTHCEESPRDFREEIIMTRHGKPIGRLVPNATRIDKLQARAALGRIRARAGSLKETFDWAAAKADRDSGRP